MVHYSDQKTLPNESSFTTTPKPPHRARMRRLLGHDPLKSRAIEQPSIQFHFDSSSHIDACGTEIYPITIPPPHEYGRNKTGF